MGYIMKTRIATIIYQEYINSKWIKKKVLFFIRKLLIKALNDPICLLLVHGRYLNIPFSHPLPDYLQKFRFYDRLPERISTYIHQKKEPLICIDVGANIGDTVAAFYKKDTDIFLAIEPNPKFNKLLVENWGWSKNVTVISDICSSSSSEDTFVIQEKIGTSSILSSESTNAIKMNCRTLDDIVKDYPFAMKANVIKIDTDGHDFSVIKGSEKLLSNNLPFLLFECDVFNNINYTEDCIKTLVFFQKIGYNHFLLYDTFGNLMGKHSLSNLSAFQDLLFYQLTSDFYYFDILIISDNDICEFYQAEIDYFTDKILNKSLQPTAIKAISSKYRN